MIVNNLTHSVKGKPFPLRQRLFKSFDEMVSYAVKPLSEDVINNYKYGVEQQANKNFNGETYQDGITQAQSGWKKGWEIAKKMSSDFRVSLGESSISKVTKPNVHGQSVSMSRYIMGDPRCMRNSQRKRLKKQGKIVKIFFHSGYLSNIKKSQVKRRGAAILALINSLQSTGYRVEVEAGFLAEGTGGGDVYSDYRFKVKDAEQPIDEDRMGFVLVSPCMHRVVGFRVREHEDLAWHQDYGTFPNQGSSRDYKGDLSISDADVYLGVNDNDWDVFNSDSSAKKWLREQFEIYGVKTEDSL